MDIKRPPARQLILSPKEYKSFVPNPLPPDFPWNDQIANALSRADFLLGKLARESEQLPHPHLLSEKLSYRVKSKAHKPLLGKY